MECYGDLCVIFLGMFAFREVLLFVCGWVWSLCRWVLLGLGCVMVDGWPVALVSEVRPGAEILGRIVDSVWVQESFDHIPWVRLVDVDGDVIWEGPEFTPVRSVGDDL